MTEKRERAITLFRIDPEQLALAALRVGKTPPRLITDAGLSQVTVNNINAGKLVRGDTVFKIGRAAGLPDPAVLVKEIVTYGKAKND